MDNSNMGWQPRRKPLSGRPRLWRPLRDTVEPHVDSFTVDIHISSETTAPADKTVHLPDGDA